jgi:hypothetical protein
MQGLIVVVSPQVLDDAKESFLTYVRQIGALPEVTELRACRVRPPCNVLSADLIGLARHGSTGEIIFHVISWKVAVDLGRSPDKNTITANCAALLRCTPELQKRWILSLYETTEDKT